MTQTYGTTHNSKTEAFVGNCTNHPDPDMWFPEYGSGPVTPNRTQRIADKVNEAIRLCNTCPVKERCLEMGMQPEDLTFGIWGGKLAGQRLLETGYKREEHAQFSEAGRAVRLYEILEPLLEVV
jgi:hypothetical protein